MTGARTLSSDALALTPEVQPVIDTGVARAVYGLVDDEYGVVAHTPNLTREQARELCRAVSVGDPTVPVDDALSFLYVPGWGYVCTRYATERDSRGRLALVSDSVVVDAASFRALRGDPLRCMPRRADFVAARDNPGGLTVPRFAPSAPEAESTRLVEARRGVDERHELRPLLAALLAGDRVLYLSPGAPIGPALLQCVVLLLPPSLRGRMTFQTLATRAPLHAPRLTGADRRYAELGAVEWTRELPREAGASDPRADAACDALLALSSDVLLRAHALYEELVAGDVATDVAADGSSLLAEVERVVRCGALLQALDAGRVGAADALRALGDDSHPGERRERSGDGRETTRLTELVLDALPPSVVAEGIVALMGERTVTAWRAAARLARELLRLERGATRMRDEAARHALDAVLASADRVRWTDDEPSRVLRAALAVAATRRGDCDRFVQLVEANAPWSALGDPLDGAHVPNAANGAQNAHARLAGAVLAALASLDAAAASRTIDTNGAILVLDALGALAPELSAPARRDAAALALAVAARAVTSAAHTATAAHSTATHSPAPLLRVADALVAFWNRVPPADERDEALRELLAPRPRVATEPDQRATLAARRIASLPAAELAGWLGAATLRALASGRGVSAVVSVLTIDGDARDASPATNAIVTDTLGALLVAAAGDGPPLHDGWPALIERVAPTARRELLVRALARVTNGAPSLDELAATCDALAALGFQLDEAAATAIAAPLARWAATLPATRVGAMRLGMTIDLLGTLADVSGARALAASVLAGATESLGALVKLRRLAAAAADVEATRDPAAWTAHRAMLAAHATSGELLPNEVSTLRELLGMNDGTAARLLGVFRREGRR